MKVAFIEPLVNIVEPLGIAYLAQPLIDDGHQVKYLESPRPNFFKRLKDFKPDILAYSITTGKHRLSRNLNRIIRKQINGVSLFGGPHCTLCPEFIESDDLIDGVCVGEGEFTMPELLHRMRLRQDYTSVAGWWLKKEGIVYKNNTGQNIKDLDKLPFPNREIIYSENGDLRDTPIKRILGSRGCPYSCSYCFNKKYNEIYAEKGDIYRSRSPENIINEACRIRERYPLKYIRFVEDIFGLQMDYDSFTENYRKKVAVPFTCHMRPDLISEHKIKKLKDAGCVAVSLGIESGNEFIRNKVLNRNLSYDQLDKSIAILKKEGIRVWTQNIVANPGETFKMALETFKLNAKHKVDFAECFILVPYPGTEIHKYCYENGFFKGNLDSLPKTYSLNSCLNFKSKRDKNRLVNFQKFFSFAVKHPRSLPVIKILIMLPPNKLFFIFNRIYDGWRMIQLVEAKLNIRNFATARNYFKFISSFFLKTTNEDGINKKTGF